MSRKLLLFWQNPATRLWITVGLLEQFCGSYFFKYSKSARTACDAGEFVPFGVMRDLSKVYEAKELFPIFKNRLLAKSRPEYAEYLSWLNLTKDSATDMDELSRSGGIRATDQLQLFPYPLADNGAYRAEFFVHGVRYLTPEQIERIALLKSGDELFLMKDTQNRIDSWALAIRTEDPPTIIGYCPGFFVKDFSQLLDLQYPQNVKLSVSKVNLTAPLQLRLLCKLDSPWPEDFVTFADEEFDQEGMVSLKAA